MSGGQSGCDVRPDRGHGSTTPGYVDVYYQVSGLGLTLLELDGAGGPTSVVAGGGPVFLRQTGRDVGISSAVTAVPIQSLQLTRFGNASISVTSTSQTLPAPDIAVPEVTGNTSLLEVSLSSNLTMSSTPTITLPTVNGQMLCIKNASDGSGATLTLQDVSSLSGSGIHTASGSNRALANGHWQWFEGRVGAVTGWFEAG